VVIPAGEHVLWPVCDKTSAAVTRTTMMHTLHSLTGSVFSALTHQPPSMANALAHKACSVVGSGEVANTRISSLSSSSGAGFRFFFSCFPHLTCLATLEAPTGFYIVKFKLPPPPGRSFPDTVHTFLPHQVTPTTT
jgi:hypothetical protein